MEKGYVTEAEVQTKMRDITAEPPPSHLAPYRHIMPYVASPQRRTVIPPSGSATKEEAMPQYAVGDVVRVKAGAPLGHTRVPRYVRGKVGVITHLHGNFILPDQRVADGSTLYQPVYRVCFAAQHVWGNDAAPKDKLYLEMWEAYIEPEGQRA
jgi:nitrile hydratase